MALAINIDRRKIKGMYVVVFLATNIQTNSKDKETKTGTK